MLIDILNELHNEIDNEWQYVNVVINGLSTPCITNLFDEFVLIDRNRNSINMLRNRHGIYIVLATEDVELSFNDINRYNSIKGAKWKDINRSGLWVDECLYTGSCISQSLLSRINTHFDDRDKNAGLHLNHPARCIFADKVRFFVFPIKKEYDKTEYLKLLVPELERKMHEVFYPAAGSSRT